MRRGWQATGGRRRRIVAPAALTMVLALTLGSCAGDDEPSATSPASVMPSMDHGNTVSPAVERPSTDATLGIVAPTNGDVIRNTSVDLEISLDGARVVDQTSTDLRPDQGHLHVLLDDALISMTEGLTQSIDDLDAGQHVLKVEFVANDHAPFEPRVIEAVTFEVDPG